MRICLVLAFAAALQGAIIRGTVVEAQTGHFLARAVVDLEPVAGSAGPRLSVRTNASGFFEFASIPAGTYLVAASRRAFAPVQYGQKHWRASGVPIVIAQTDSTFLNIRLPRLGSIAGTLFDENDVGLPDHGVAIYTDAHPLTPYEGANYSRPEGEAVRDAVNNWIRTSHAFDAVVDFEAATRDPANPTSIRAEFDPGDHLHPNNAGYKAMANAIDLSIFTRK